MRGSKVEFEENLEKLWALGELGKENLERKKRLAEQPQEKKKLGLLSRRGGQWRTKLENLVYLYE